MYRNDRTDHAATECYARRVHHLRALQPLKIQYLSTRARLCAIRTLRIRAPVDWSLAVARSTFSAYHSPLYIRLRLVDSHRFSRKKIQFREHYISSGNLLLFSKREWNHVTDASIKEINLKKNNHARVISEIKLKRKKYASDFKNLSNMFASKYNILMYTFCIFSAGSLNLFLSYIPTRIYILNEWWGSKVFPSPRQSQTIDFLINNSKANDISRVYSVNSSTEQGRPRPRSMARFRERDVVALHRITLSAFIAKRVKFLPLHVGRRCAHNLICRQEVSAWQVRARVHLSTSRGKRFSLASCSGDNLISVASRDIPCIDLRHTIALVFFTSKRAYTPHVERTRSAEEEEVTSSAARRVA